MKAGFSTGLNHYDAPPPDHIEDVCGLRDADAFRFANVLTGWAEFDGEGCVAYGQDGGTVMGSTTVRVGKLDATFAAVSLPELRPAPVCGDGWVAFTQTCGGRTALPLPRRISRPPFVRLQSPVVWTTLRLTIHADGRNGVELVGASPFPRHWIYDASGNLALKAGVANWREWIGQSSSAATPWGDEDSPVVVTAAESALERQLSKLVMAGAMKPRIRCLAAGEILTSQGEPGNSIYLVLDGVVDVCVDGRPVGDLGPGAVLGERAVIETARRTATVTAVTPVKVAEVTAQALDIAALQQLAANHRRELTLDLATP
jgi:cyclic nucleotide-binding protein